MVATATTHGTIDPSPIKAPGGERDEQHIELSDLGRRPGLCRGVTPHASDPLSCMERRGSIYLPI
jgi:hypothetical protein